MFRLSQCGCALHSSISTIEYALFAVILHQRLGLDPSAIVDRLASLTDSISRNFPGIIAQA